MEHRIERIRMVRGKDEFLVAPRGVDKLLNEGWTQVGANQDPQESKVSGGNPVVDSGAIIVKPLRKKK